MARRAMPRPTDAELAILRVLWESGPSTVRAVCESLNRRRPTGYTTVLKLMQIMLDKGLLARDEQHQSHVYRTAKDERQTQKLLLRDLLERAFGGSTRKLILGALSAKRASAEDLAAVRSLLDQLEGDAK